jgi:hypothetical protein
MKKPRLLLFALLLVLPIVGVLGLVAVKQVAIVHSTTMRLPIVGYDPRDLMYGQYLRFRFEGPNAPDKEPHNYFIPEDSARTLEKTLARTGKHAIELDVQVSGKQVTGYGMLYIDKQPWRDYLNSRKAK